MFLLCVWVVKVRVMWCFSIGFVRVIMFLVEGVRCLFSKV